MDWTRAAGLLRWGPLAAIILGNLVPLYGVLALGWDVALLMLLFWCENAVIGLYNVLKMATVGDLRAVFLVPFFLVHYGLFMTVHLFFIVFLFLVVPVGLGTARLGSAVPDAVGLLPTVGAAAAVFLLTHGVDFFLRFLPRERKTADIQKLFAGPYARIAVLHVTIIFAGFTVVALGQPVAALAFLVAVKIAVEVAMELRARRKAAVSDAPSPPSHAAGPRPPEGPFPPGTPGSPRLR